MVDGGGANLHGDEDVAKEVWHSQKAAQPIDVNIVIPVAAKVVVPGGTEVTTLKHSALVDIVEGEITAGGTYLLVEETT